jgi:putative drug exporter of the RND superfamily
VLVLSFQHGWGHTLLGLNCSPQIDGWIAIFLFAVLFGLSMDCEVSCAPHVHTPRGMRQE